MLDVATTDNRVIAELLVHLGRIASQDHEAELMTPAQWAVLRYFARANRYSRIPSAFAEFHGTTRGTASQTIKNMENLGYLTRVRSPVDGRSTLIELTEKARSILHLDPLEALVRATDALTPNVRSHFTNALQQMLCQVALDVEKPQFGACESCAHLKSSQNQEGSTSYICDISNDPLNLNELKQLCIKFIST